jgi:hypothetical protein
MDGSKAEYDQVGRSAQLRYDKYSIGLPSRLARAHSVLLGDKRPRFATVEVCTSLFMCTNPCACYVSASCGRMGFKGGIQKNKRH